MATIERKKNGSVSVVVSDGYDADGRQIRSRMTVPAADLEGLTEKQREREINKRAVEFESKVKAGKFLDGERATLAEFGDAWLKDYAERRLAPGTFANYSKMWSNRIRPALGHMRLARIQPLHLLRFYNSLADPGSRRDDLYVLREAFYPALDMIEGVAPRTRESLKEGGATNKTAALRLSAALGEPLGKVFEARALKPALSPGTAKEIFSLVGNMLQSAAEWQSIESNPARRVRLPRAPRREIAIMGGESLDLMIEKLGAEDLRHRLFVLLALETGCRLGELSALNWADVDFEGKTISVSKTLQNLPGAGTFEKAPKTVKSVRIVDIDGPIWGLLAEHRKEWLENRLRKGGAWIGSDRVFARLDGGDMRPDSLSNWHRRFLRRCGLPHFKFHGLRHENASAMLAAGVDLKTMADRLGHAAMNITFGTYSHSTKELSRAAAKKISGALNKPPTNLGQSEERP